MKAEEANQKFLELKVKFSSVVNNLVIMNKFDHFQPGEFEQKLVECAHQHVEDLKAVSLEYEHSKNAELINSVSQESNGLFKRLGVSS